MPNLAVVASVTVAGPAAAVVVVGGDGRRGGATVVDVVARSGSTTCCCSRTRRVRSAATATVASARTWKITHWDPLGPNRGHLAVRTASATGSMNSADAAGRILEVMAEARPVLANDDGVRAVYAAHGPELYRFALRSLGDRGLAEEAVQETFVRAWQAANRFDDALGSLRTWLFAIIRNVVIDLSRARAVRPDARRPRAGRTNRSCSTTTSNGCSSRGRSKRRCRS